ncbi:hypothetical protein ERK18_00920 [Lactobacillus kimbladii]|uniref:hypothetical protein n=1 Tax=Lactobacillus kimbladii TaxID=1218506 RepID=UPI001650D24B|nr:hypothetical protein [Lactobacillus kimbladii]MBC6341593.1 hypothetical protein [Lactobacillus kimbladii]
MFCEQCRLSQEINALSRYLIFENLRSEISEDFGEHFFKIQDKYLISNTKYMCDRCKTELNKNEWIYINEEELFEELGRLVAMSLPEFELFDGSDNDMIIADVNETYKDDEIMRDKICDEVSDGNLLINVIKEQLDFCCDDLLPEIKDEIINYLKQNHILSDFDDMHTRVLTKSDIEFTNRNFYKDYDEDVSFSLNKSIEYINSLNMEELDILKKDINNDKFLENNRVFKNLRIAIQHLSESHIGTYISRGKFYRARSMSENNSSKLKRLNAEQLKKDALTPPLGIPSQGRWNKGGKPTALYISNEYSQLPREINFNYANQKNKLVIFCLETYKKRFLLPVSLLLEDSKLYKKVSEPVNKNDKKSYKQQYVLSNLLGKIILNSGYDGIIYDPIGSNDKEAPLNFALFNHDVTNLEEFKDIKINGYFICNN